jgi:hypothetical protein
VRSGFVSACLLVAACATPPQPLPPRRQAFAPQAAPVPRPPDLATPTEPPVRHERYLGLTLLADLVAIVPLVRWMGRPEDVYLAAPSLVLSPLIHAAHGETEKSMLSLAMRGAMVGLVYLAGRSARDECDDSNELVCVPAGSILLANLAIVPVVLIDSIFLARRVTTVEGWRRLPVIPAVSATADGRRMLTLTFR